MVEPKHPQGMPEYLPSEQRVFNNMLATIRQGYELFGFTPIETPAMELSDVLLAKAGGETDKQVYRLGENGEYCLHFDLTVPLARYAAEHQADLAFPFRRYQIQKVWRGERPQQGRFREFYQCDIDVIGSESPLVDAEIVSVINYVFGELSVGGFVVRISNRKIITGYMESLGVSEENAVEVLRIVDKIEKQDRSTLESDMAGLGLNPQQIAKVFEFVAIEGKNEEVLAQLKKLGAKNPVFDQGVEELSAVIQGIKSLGVPESNYQIDLGIARGLDYYTGTVYETRLTDYPSFGSVCSGGRFDNLTSYYTETKLPGVGISIGLTRLFAQLKAAGAIKPEASTPSRVLIAQIDTACQQRCLEVASKLRQSGVNTEVYPDIIKVGKQFKYADRQGIPYVIVIGETELAENTVTIKNMADSDGDKRGKVCTLEEVIKDLNVS